MPEAQEPAPSDVAARSEAEDRPCAGTRETGSALWRDAVVGEALLLGTACNGTIDLNIDPACAARSDHASRSRGHHNSSQVRCSRLIDARRFICATQSRSGRGALVDGTVVHDGRTVRFCLIRYAGRACVVVMRRRRC